MNTTSIMIVGVGGQGTLLASKLLGNVLIARGYDVKLSAMADVTAVDALALAEQAGSPKAVNVVLIGVLSKLMDIPEEAWQKAIDETVPARFLEMNKKAFALGRNA